MAKRKNYFKLFMEFCKEYQLWFSVYPSGVIETVTAAEYGEDLELPDWLELGSKEALDATVRAFAELAVGSGEWEKVKYLVNEPGFIALKKKYYNDFKQGLKNREYRIYGGRWLCRNYPPGRPMVLSCGYGRKNRLSAVVKRAFVERHARLPSEVHLAMKECFDFDIDPETEIFVIEFHSIKEIDNG